MTAGWSPVAPDDLADDPLGVEAVGGVGEVDLLPGAPADPVPVRRLRGDLRVQPGQPHRHRVGRRAEDHADAAAVRGVEHRLPASRGRTRPSSGSQVDHTDSPTRMTVKPACGHQVEVGLDVGRALVLGVVGRAEADAVHQSSLPR